LGISDEKEDGATGSKAFKKIKLQDHNNIKLQIYFILIKAQNLKIHISNSFE
jgi:hypothetical protein